MTGQRDLFGFESGMVLKGQVGRRPTNPPSDHGSAAGAGSMLHEGLATADGTLWRLVEGI